MDSLSDNQRRGVRVLIGVGLAGLAVHVAYLGLGLSGLDGLVNDWVYNTVEGIAAALCLSRGMLIARERWAWLMIGAGLASWTIGDVYWTLAFTNAQSIPYPSPADVFYLAAYPALYAGIVLLVRSRVPRFHTSQWLDGAIGALAIAGLGAAVLFPAILDSTSGSAAAVATNLAYPLADLLLLGIVVGVLALTGWRPGRAWALIAAALVVNAVADGIFLYQGANGTYVDGTLLDSVWLCGALLLGLAAWTPSPRSAPRLEGLRLMALPTLFALIAVALLVYGQVEALTGLALGLATATLLLVVVRMVITFSENLRLLASARWEAVTDPLTGLGNRRKLVADLSAAVESSREGVRHVVAIYDLDGFKAYNDSYGHAAGDSLLRRMGANLAGAVQGRGVAYRLGGDEFCVIAPTAGAKPESVLASAGAALSEVGEGFAISNSSGAILLPDDADDASTALRVADHRMYVKKGRRPQSAERQTRDVLMRTLREREPELGRHLDGVAALAARLAREVGLDPEEVDVVARAGELHDVGKMAIPDEVLHKPGPLDDVEWGMMRKHTLIGERILGAAPAMVPVARLVRSSHERWDGSGYPDGRAGEEIPLGARIVAICDAYDAMVSERPYRSAIDPEDALEELRRGAAKQFDPRLVELFCERIGSVLASS